jgi:hypothetical protein
MSVNKDASAFSALTENKTVLHLVIEGIVVFGMFYYFSSKNRKLTDHIEELTQRLEEYEERMNNIENVLKNVNLSFNQLAKQTQENFISLKSVVEENLLKTDINLRSANNRTSAKVVTQESQNKRNGSVSQLVKKSSPVEVTTKQTIDLQPIGAVMTMFVEEQPSQPLKTTQLFQPVMTPSEPRHAERGRSSPGATSLLQPLTRIEEVTEKNDDDSDVDIDIQDELNEMNNQ